MTGDALAHAGMILLQDTALKSLILCLVSGLALLCLRRASAAVRHLVLLLSVMCLLFLPLLSGSLPGWRVAVWPHAAPAALPLPNQPAAPPVVSSAPPPPSVAETSPPPPLTVPVMPAPARPVGVRLSWPLLVVSLWAVGVCVVLLPILAGLVGVRRLARRASPVSSEAILGLTADLGQQLGLRRPVTLLQGAEGDAAVVPMTWSWRRPVVLLPSTADAWTPERLRVVLLHELAHVRRHDWPGQMLAHGVCALYWFHPGVWLVARQMRIESERACDDQVLAMGVPASDYAQHLVDVARSLSQAPPRLALPMAQFRIGDRVRDLLTPRRRSSCLSRPAAALAVSAAVGLLGLVAGLHPVAQAQTPPAPSERRPNTPEEDAADLKRVYGLISVYRQRHGGAYPVDEVYLMSDIYSHLAAYGFATREQVDSVFTAWQQPSPLSPVSSERLMNVALFDRRPDGQLVGSPKPAAARDLLAKTIGHEPGKNGYSTLLWDDGSVEKINMSQVLVYPAQMVPTPHSRPHPLALPLSKAEFIRQWKVGQDLELAAAWPGQTGLPPSTLTEQEFAALQTARANTRRKLDKGSIHTTH